LECFFCFDVFFYKGIVKLLMHEDAVWVLEAARALGATAEEKTANVRFGQAKLLGVATTFLKKLQKSVALIPMEVRCMAYLIWINARTFCQERSAVLLGGFIFLRIINPALVSPEAMKLVPQNEKVGASFKPNSIALCRLLQMLSNNKRYPVEEGALLNEWLDKNHEAMDSYLLDVASDPNYVEGTRPFAVLSRMPDERNRRLRETLDDKEWEALHVALVRSKTHVLVRAALAPMLSSAMSPRSSSSNSLPASPLRSRSGSRFRGEDEELAIYNDGKMRMRPARRGSLSGGAALFANMSSPSLSHHVPSPQSPSTPTALRATSPAAGKSDSADGSIPRITIGIRGRSRTNSSTGSPSASSSPRNESPGLRSQVVLLQRDEGSGSAGGEESGDKPFFALLETLPLPECIRLERFEKSIEQLKRPQLVVEGVLSDGRRASVKLASSQVDVLVRMAVALLDKEYGIKGFFPVLFFFCVVKFDFGKKKWSHSHRLCCKNGPHNGLELISSEMWIIFLH
jgi:hypothetical protein